MRILNPSNPEDAFTLQDIAQAQRETRLPTCMCCKRPIRSETSLNMSAFGLNGYACERCVYNHTVFTEELEGNTHDGE